MFVIVRARGLLALHERRPDVNAPIKSVGKYNNEGEQEEPRKQSSNLVHPIKRPCLTKNPIKGESNQTKGEGETRVNAKHSHQVRYVILRRVLHDRIRSQRAQKFQPALSAGFFGVAKFVP